MQFNQKLIINGAIWVTIISVLGIPFTMYLNWILGIYDLSGLILGKYAIIIIIINTVTTFTLLGGSSVLTNFMPKIDKPEDRGRFVFTYMLICIFMLLVVLLILLESRVANFIFGDEITKKEIKIMLTLAPFLLISQLVIFANQGRMMFKRASLLNQLQVFLLSLVVTVLFFFNKKILLDNSIFVFSLVLIITYIIIIIMGTYKQIIVLGFYWTKRINNFVFYSFFNTINTYLFSNFDKLIVVNYIGIKDLGVYFVLVQIAMLIKFLSIKISQVLLSSFSNYVHSNNISELKNVYSKISELIIFSSTFFSIGLIILSIYIQVIFGELYTQNSSILLIILIFGVNFSSIGSVNSMLVLAKEMNKSFFISNTVLIIFQLSVTLIFIKDYGIWAAVLGKVIGYIIGQLGLFYILNKLKLVRIHKDYYLSQLIVVFSCIIGICFHLGKINFLSLIIFLLFMIILFLKKTSFEYNKYLLNFYKKIYHE
jgi:O-antigen/teichoic acid export membrane protein